MTHMKITISTFGVRGDVQPYLALSVGLQAAGHRVTLATSHDFTAWIEGYGVNTHPCQFSTRAFTQAQAAMRGQGPVRQVQLVREFMRRLAAARSEVWDAIEDADVVIQSPTGTGALEAVSRRGVGAVLAAPVPFAPTRAFPSFFLGAPRLALGGGFNYLTHHLMHQVLWSALGGPLTNPLRKQLGLRPWRSFGALLAHARQMGVPMLYGYSAQVLPKPADWDDTQHLTGYWWLEPPAGWLPAAAPDLLRFLDSGPPPIYIGFGSMTAGDAERRSRLAVRALELSGQRGVLLTGWGGLASQAAPANVCFVEDVPHAWLFGQMSAIVHHGGAGTTGAALRAGVPSLVTPFLADQSAWAERVVQLGVGPRLPGIGRLTAETLAAAMHTAVTNTALRDRAAALGEKIRAEDGVGTAVRLIEAHAARRQPVYH
jgi:sterol 3beta-glucosyltransferase